MFAARRMRGPRSLFRTGLRSQSSAPPFVYQELFDLAPDTTTPYKKLTSDHVSTVTMNGMEFLQVQPEALRLLSAQAMVDIAHLLRPAHLGQLSKILQDPEATSNDRFVAFQLLKNANIASNMVLPGCQDTGTAIISGKRGQYVLTDGKDEAHLSHGVSAWAARVRPCVACGLQRGAGQGPPRPPANSLGWR